MRFILSLRETETGDSESGRHVLFLADPSPVSRTSSNHRTRNKIEYSPVNSMLHFTKKCSVKSFLDPLTDTLILFKLQRF